MVLVSLSYHQVKIHMGIEDFCFCANLLYFNSVVLNQGQFCPPENTWKCLETFLVVKTVGDRDGDFSGLLMGRWRQEMLLNILQCPGQPPTPKSYLALNVSSAEAKELCFNLMVPLSLCRCFWVMDHISLPKTAT